MKKFFNALWKKIKGVFVWTWKQLKDKTNLVIFIICFIVLSCEIWIPYLLGFITGNAWWFGIGSACWAFWLAPFTPFLPLCIGLTFIVRKLYDKIRNRRKKMKLKPKNYVVEPRALVYRRFIGLEKSINLQTVYQTLSNGVVWFFDVEKQSFNQFTNLTEIPQTSKVIQVEDFNTIMQYKENYFQFNGNEWATLTTLPSNYTPLSASFNNIAKYQTNKYYYVGSFNFTIQGSIEGATSQFIKGNIIPLTSMNIKYFNDDVNLSTDDLVVVEKRLYSVENPETTQKHQPKAFTIHFATLNSIL